MFGMMRAFAQENPTVYLPTLSGSAVPDDDDTITRLEGFVLKGPFIQGTEVTARELNAKLIPTGRTFTGIVEDNTGRFQVLGQLESPFVELSANGFYFNEVTGQISNAQINLTALVDMRENSTVNVNVLTHLSY